MGKNKNVPIETQIKRINKKIGHIGELVGRYNKSIKELYAEYIKTSDETRKNEILHKLAQLNNLLSNAIENSKNLKKQLKDLEQSKLTNGNQPTNE